MTAPDPPDILADRLRILIDPRELAVRSWVRMVRVHDRMVRRLEGQLARRGLSLAQFDLLATLFHGEGVSQRELAESLLVTKGNICGLIDRAEGSGWVERRPDPDDRRANRIHLTDAGRALIAEILPEHAAQVRRVFDRLGPDGLAGLHETLGRLESLISNP